MTVTSFTPSIEQAVLDDLRDRLRGTRWPDGVEDAGWDYGMDLDVLRSFVATWLDDYDWAAEQERIAAFPHVRIEVGGLGLHAVHVRSTGSGTAMPLVMLHGWPSSFVQMLPMIPQLTADGFDVVVLSLPGYGFSDRASARGMDVTRIARLVVEAMAELGYDRFAARGSDLGAGVLQQLALNHPST